MNKVDYPLSSSGVLADGSCEIVWFLCPTIALTDQQLVVLKSQLPSFQVRVLSGNDRVDRWSEQQIWDEALRNINIIVSTSQVLLDALIHGFVHMDGIGLLVFDEAHHCVGNDPTNKIMQNFYHTAVRAGKGDLPHILGLTASPVIKMKEDGLR